MTIKNLLEELNQNSNFINLQKENPDLFFCAAFLVLDIETKTEKIQLDFFLPNEKKITAFEYPFAEGKKYEDEISQIQKQEVELAVDKNNFEENVKKSLEKNNCKISPTKIIAILKNNQWNITVMDKFLSVIRLKLDAKTGDEISFNKGSLRDFMGIRKNNHNNK